MTTVTRKFTFDAGHRVLGHSGKCRHLHGHTYTAEVTVAAEGLDNLGMVVDFGVIKEKVGTWLDQNWDHNLILHRRDPIMCLVPEARECVCDGREPYVLPGLLNPTAEVMAEHLYRAAQSLLEGFRVVRVRLWETPNCYADYGNPDSVET